MPQLVELGHEQLQRTSLLFWIGPIDVEGCLDAGHQQHLGTGPLGDGRRTPAKEPRRAHDQLAGRVPEQIECVLHAARSFKRAGIHRHAKRARQLAPVETTGLTSQLDGALQEPPIHVGADQSLAEIDQRSLREGRLRCAKTPEHHLYPQIDDGELDHLRVGHAEVSLDERRHRHERRRHRLLPGASVSIHALELGLELVIEQYVPMQPQEPEELAHSIEALAEHLLLPTQLLGRDPSRDRHALRDHNGRSPSIPSRIPAGLLTE